MKLCAFCSMLLLLIQAVTPPPPGVAPVGPLDTATPGNAQERMALATRVNGLLGLDIPWHLQASYELFDPDGKSREKGTYEEWRINDKQYKIVLKSPSLSVQEYRTEQGLFRTGGEWPLQPLSRIQNLIERPVRWQNGEEEASLENYELKVDGNKNPCTERRTKPKQSAEVAWSFCFAPTNAILVFATSDDNAFQTIFQNISRIHGRYFAKDMQEFLLGKPWLTIHVDHLEGISQAFLAAFSIPPDATPVPLRLPSAGDVPSTPRLLNKAHPVYPYPAEAKWKHIEGVVLLNGVIDTEGRVKALVVLAGPPALHEAALQMVRNWTYTPTLIDGKPVEVEMTARINFRLGD
jgi:TonB family protein